MKLSRVISGILLCSIILNAWLGYRTYSIQIRNRQALAYLAESIAYRLTVLTPFSDEVPESPWVSLLK